MMIYANLDYGFKQEGWLFDNAREFGSVIADSPDIINVSDIVRFDITGNTREERAASLRQIAIDFQSAEQGGLSMLELDKAQRFFRDKGKYYGLLEEFEENGIC